MTATAEDRALQARWDAFRAAWPGLAELRARAVADDGTDADIEAWLAEHRRAREAFQRQERRRRVRCRGRTCP